MFWKVGVSIFFVEILEKNFFFLFGFHTLQGNTNIGVLILVLSSLKKLQLLLILTTTATTTNKKVNASSEPSNINRRSGSLNKNLRDKIGICKLRLRTGQGW